MARILIADDDNISRTLAACLHSPAPDVAVLDHRMPHLTGLEVARRIVGRIPFLMMSAEETARAECMRVGGIAYLRKPPDLLAYD